VPAIALSLRETVDYALEAKGGGFRLRMAQQTGLACGLSVDAVTELANGIEYFHHASLIFDDLPCMDDASERRGRRCVHKVAGESQAILAGLALVNRAYAACWKVAARYPRHSLCAARLVERCIGELGILNGQSRDLSFEPSLGAKEVKAIAAGKTGALLQLTLLLPAMIGGLSFSEMLQLSRLARYWGIAYQGMDDFYDLHLFDASSGKTPFRDVVQQRPNLVVALGSQAAYREIEYYLAGAGRQIDRLVKLNSKWVFLSDFHAILMGKEEGLRSVLERANA
jgi:geranylgeranyl pyrophosphate synthase